MSTKTDFTDSEWETLRRAPMVAGMGITFADPGGPIEVLKETSAVLKFVTAESAASEDLVPITALLYSAEAATQRLTSLRATVRGLLAEGSPDRAVLQDLIEEVFDLVELGAGGGR